MELTEQQAARLVHLVALLLVLLPLAVPMLRHHRRRLRVAGALVLAGGLVFGMVRAAMMLF